MVPKVPAGAAGGAGRSYVPKIYGWDWDGYSTMLSKWLVWLVSMVKNWVVIRYNQLTMVTKHLESGKSGVGIAKEVEAALEVAGIDLCPPM